MRALCWIGTLLGAIFGGLLLLTAFAGASAPQQGAVAAMAVGLAVIPYCFARAVSELLDGGRH